MSRTHRNLLQLGWTAQGTRGLEAVTQTAEQSINLYYQVTHCGREVLQTIDLQAAQIAYDALPVEPRAPTSPK